MHACKERLGCFGDTFGKMRGEACCRAASMIIIACWILLLILPECKSDAHLLSMHGGSLLRRSEQGGGMFGRDCRETLSVIQQMCPHASGREILWRELDYFECPAAMCNFIPNFRNSTVGCRVEWSKVCAVDENGTDTCCPHHKTDLPVAQILHAWNSSSHIDNSRERSIVGYIFNVSIPPGTFRQNRSVVQQAGLQHLGWMPFPPAYSLMEDRLRMQDVPRRPITVQARIWNGSFTPCKGSQVWVFFHFDSPRNAWIPLANQVVSGRHISGQILPSMAIRNRLLIDISLMRVHIPTPSPGVSPFDFSLANEVNMTLQSYWNLNEQNRDAMFRCGTVIFTRGDRRVDRIRASGLVALGTPVQREWDSVPNSTVQMKMMVPSAAAFAWQEAVLSPAAQRRLLFVEPVWASFYNQTSGEWEKLQSCTYSASSSAITCYLQPHFFSQAGLQIMFVAMTSNSSMIASAMAREEEAQNSNMLLAFQAQPDDDKTMVPNISVSRTPSTSTPPPSSQEGLSELEVAVIAAVVFIVVAIIGILVWGLIRRSQVVQYTQLQNDQKAGGKNNRQEFVAQNTVSRFRDGNGVPMLEASLHIFLDKRLESC
jgi:hypothetical protein